MNRDAIIHFIEKIRPAIKEAGAPEKVLLDSAREHNLSDAQLESTAQMLNTAQQLNFMDKSAARGDSFKLIDVPALVNDYITHQTPVKEAGEKSYSFSSNFSDMEKAATVKKEGDKYLLISKKGKVLGTHSSAKEAWAQEAAIKHSQKEQEKKATVVLQDPTLERPLTGKRLPNINQMALKDAGARSEYVSIGEAPPQYPEYELTSYKAQLRKQAETRNEFNVLNQLITDRKEDFRKEADDIMFRIRTEPEFEWAVVKSDGLVLAKEATEKAAPVLENYFSQHTGHLKVAFSTEPAPQRSCLVDDTFNTVPVLEKVANIITQLEDITTYYEHVKKSSMVDEETEPRVGEVRNTDDNEDEGDYPAPRVGDVVNRSDDTTIQAPSTQGVLSHLEDVLFPSMKAKSPTERHDDLAKGIDTGSRAMAEGMKSILPAKTRELPMDFLKSIENMAPKTNTNQKIIDDAITDVKTVTTLERLMLTDPIIRDADPDMVKGLFNTLQNANPEFTRDPNLLRFALREAIQYESVPTHTYRDLVEIEERKSKTRESQGKVEDARYRIGKGGGGDKK